MYVHKATFKGDVQDIMELYNRNCGLMCDDSNDEDDLTPTNSPVSPRRVISSPPLPPRRPSPSPTPNTGPRNGQHLIVPKENAPPPPVTVILSSNENQQNNKANTEAKYDMLHRASSPSPVPPAVVRTHAQSHCTPPALPEKAGRQSTASTPSGPPVPPPLSAPRPPKTPKEIPEQDHHYENTIIIPGTGQHVVKNISLEINRARFTALMRGKDEAGGPITKAESAAYENVNVEYISKLTSLGFPQDAVIRALGITRNDLEMARDILQEFAAKSS